MNPSVEVADTRNVQGTAEANSGGAVERPWEHPRGKLDSTRLGELENSHSAWCVSVVAGLSASAAVTHGKTWCGLDPEKTG